MNESNNVNVINKGLIGNFLYAYDLENNILHLRDKDDHNEKSLINSISSEMRDKVVSKIEEEEGMKIEKENLRCFLYTDGESIGEHEIDEYIFKTDKFTPLKKSDNHLKYWFKYAKHPIIKPLPDFLQ